MNSRVVLQKAVLPARAHGWLTLGDDLLAGFVVNAADVAWANSPAKIHDAMGLGFPGSPFSPTDSFVDVLRFENATFMNPISAVGKTETSPQGFVDRPPFTGTGFVRAESKRAVIPLWWLEPTRVPQGAELWRIHSDERQELIAVYPHVALGWQPVTQEGQPAPKPFGNQLPPSDSVGTFIRWPDGLLAAQKLSNGRVVCGDVDQREGLNLSESGRWITSFEPEDAPEVFGLKVTATWRGLPFQVVRRLPDPSGQASARLVYTGRNADEAEAAGLQKTDAAVYEVTAPWQELENLTPVQLMTND